MLKSFYLSFEDPAKNLAYDEALLKEETSDSYLRFWESSSLFIVLGHGNKVSEEVHIEKAERDGIPILRRCSGGGTVIQGPGCLNYSFILSTEDEKFNTITSTTESIMSTQAEAISELLSPIDVRGTSDLSFKNKKFSGNAQRRLNQKCLFHGTLLYNFDLSLIETYLKHPPKEPDYRKNRSHLDFVQNIPTTSDNLIKVINKKWNAERKIPPQNLDFLHSLTTKYMTKNWIYKFN